MKSKYATLKTLLYAITAVITLTIFSSCKRELKTEIPRIENMGNDPTPPPYVENSDIILGTPKQNPYTVTNMQDAYSALAARNILPAHSVNIRPTHYYVKFKPTNNDQYEVL